jgi:hypothetical protein
VEINGKLRGAFEITYISDAKHGSPWLKPIYRLGAESSLWEF